MKIICNKYHRRDHKLTVGRCYEVCNWDKNYYRILDDSGEKKWYSVYYFITVEESRNNKLDYLGI